MWSRLLGGWHRYKAVRHPRQAALAAIAGGVVIAASVAASAPAQGAAGPGKSARNTTPGISLDSLPLGSVGGGFTPLPGGLIGRMPVGAGQTVTVPVAGHAGVPASGAGAVALAAAVTGGGVDGSVTVYAADGRRPGVPGLSWAARRPASGLVMSTLSSNGRVAVHNSSARPVSVTLDAGGYWLSGAPAVAGAFGPLPGRRLARVVVGADRIITVPVAGHAGVPASGAGAIALAVGVAGGRAPGSVTVYPSGRTRPNLPSLSWPLQAFASGLAVSALSSAGTVAVRNSSGRPVTMTLDADGYWLSGTPAAAGTFGPLPGASLTRLLVGPGQTVTVPSAGHGGVPRSGAGALALAVGIARAQAAGSVTVYPADGILPPVPSLSWAAQSAASGLVVSASSGTGTIAVRNSSNSAVMLTLSVVGYWLSKARTVNDIVPRPTTVALSGSNITSVSGDPASRQTVTLEAGVPPPPVGRVIIAPASSTDPNGLLGIVTGVSVGATGTRVVTLRPATLDQAYSTFDVSTSQAVTDQDVVQSSGGQAGQALTTDAILVDSTLPARSLADQPDIGYGLSKSDFDCSGRGAGPTLALTADLSKMSIDLSLDADPLAPNIHFLITADPVFDINMGFTGTVTCKLSGERHLEIQVPVPATPGLFIDIYPVVTLSADGQASIDFNWAPRAAVGFDKGPGISSQVNAFGSSRSVGISATADADLFLGFEADLDLGGRVGFGGSLGPDLSATYNANTGCVTVQGATRVNLSAHANVLVKHWDFALASGVFGTRQLYRHCGATTSPSLTLSGDLPPVMAGEPYHGAVTAAGGQPPYSFTLSSGSLPAGLSMSSTGSISGTPQGTRSATFTVQATDSAGHTGTGTFTISADTSAGGASGTD